MSDNEFLQTSWHYDKATGKDVAKVCFIFDGIASVSPNVTVDEHDAVMAHAVKECSGMVSNTAASFGRAAHVAALRFMRWLIAQELGAESEGEERAYTRAREEFVDVMEVI